MVKGLRSLDRKLRKKIPEKVRRRAAAANAVNASELVSAQRALVPKDEGLLESTIRKETVPGRVAVEVRAGGSATTKPVRNGADASYDYALGQEFGTEESPPQPFFYPPYRQKKRRFKSRQTRSIRKAIKEGAR